MFHIYSDSIEKALVIKSALLEDGELEEGELDDDDDVENKTDQPVFNTASETKILPSSNGMSFVYLYFYTLFCHLNVRIY